MKIGIVGNGFVGNATSLFKSRDVDVVIYDKDPNRCVPPDTSLQSLFNCDFVFICVPTPMNKPSGCSFRTRCPKVIAACADEVPVFETHASEHWVACPVVKNDNIGEKE